MEKLSTPLLKTFGNKFPDPGFLNSMGTPIKINESFDGKNQPDTDSEHMKELKSEAVLEMLQEARLNPEA